MRRKLVPLVALGGLLALVITWPAQGQAFSRSNALVILDAQEPASPIPTLTRGGTANQQLSDLLFLRLAWLPPTLRTAGDQGFVPQLARSWVRRDSVTLVFDLDPRARWHDGTPVTSRDVLFTFNHLRNPRVSPTLAALLRHIVDVRAEGNRRVVIRFDRPYSEQFFDATWYPQILPAHLLANLDPDSIATSPFARTPVGNGPYRWKRRVPGQLVEVEADPGFFLGRPGVERVVWRVAPDPDALFALLLSGEADALDNGVAPLTNLRRAQRERRLRLIPAPTLQLGYLLFNQRDPADTSRPHPILSDVDVRRALTLALDRTSIVRAVFGDYAAVPASAASQMLWVRDPRLAPPPFDPEAARRLLAAKGWVDRDGDGIREKDGRPLALTLNLPRPSAVRYQTALLVQRQWRDIGADVTLAALDGPTWVSRRNAGQFDIDFSSATQDPTPAALVQSWSCAGMRMSNVAKYCNPAVDSLIERGLLGKDPLPVWRQVLKTIADDQPAVFMYAPTYVTAVDRRFTDITIRPESWWAAVWTWRTVPADSAAATRRQPAGR
ncbi:MAG: peptide ABC transporter substrate-binding protein [Gemmatimonadota bacterium]